MSETPTACEPDTARSARFPAPTFRLFVDLSSAWQSRDGVALSITLDGVRKQVHIDRCALVDEDPYERDTVLDEITLFRRRPEEMERRIVHEAQSGWSGHRDFMARGP